MIIDFHTHIFPPDVRDRRSHYAGRDETFAEMYADPEAKIATAEDLLASMDSAGVDAGVALGFAWTDHEDIAFHNDYLLDAGRRSRRIVPFTTINMADGRAEDEIARCAAAGARGIGELRPENQGWDLSGEAGDRLAAAARRYGLALLFHVTEESGGEYPGKRGCSLASFHTFVRKHDDLGAVGAHLGGDIYRTDSPPDVYVDTAAQPYLYRDAEAAAAIAAVPGGRLLFGSDYPLITQERALKELREALGGRAEAALHANAEALLGPVTTAAGG